MIMPARDNSRKLTTLTPIPSQNKVVRSPIIANIKIVSWNRIVDYLNAA